MRKAAIVVLIAALSAAFVNAQWDELEQNRFLPERAYESVVTTLSPMQQYFLSRLNLMGANQEALSLTAGAMSDENNNFSYPRVDFGGTEVNYWIHQIGIAQSTDDLQIVMDRYYLFNHPDGTWGNGWLSHYISHLLSQRMWEMGLPVTQRSQFNTIMADAVREESLHLDMTCGIDRNNSCIEEWIGMLLVISQVKNYWVEVAQTIGLERLNEMEQKFLSLGFTTRHGFYGLVRETCPVDGNEYAMVLNHESQNPVYAGSMLGHVGNILYAYLSAGNSIPEYYRDPEVSANIQSMFNWMQLTALPDGSAFINGCINRGVVGPCNDPYTSNVNPTFVPGGRAVRFLLGPEAFLPGFYEFRRWEDANTGNSWNIGRKMERNTYNPEWSDAGLSFASEPDGLVVSWTAQAQATGYDVWDEAGKVGSTTQTRFEFPEEVTQIGVVTRSTVNGYDRITGVTFSTPETTPEPRVVRRRLERP